VAAVRVIPIAVALLFALGCASMPSEEVCAQRWERLALGASALDAAVTAQALRDGAVEANPLLGKRPSDARLFGFTAASHLAIRSGLRHAPARARIRAWRAVFCLRLAAVAWGLSQR
jgi:hypothetical protein